MSTWEAASGKQLLYCKDAHYSDTQCVDVVDDVIVSGSKDNTVKVNTICIKYRKFFWCAFLFFSAIEHQTKNWNIACADRTAFHCCCDCFSKSGVRQFLS